MFKAIPWISKTILVISIVALFLFSMVFFVAPGNVYADSEHPVMHISDAVKAEWIKDLVQGPWAEIKAGATRAPGVGTTNLISHLTYTPVERDQGVTGTCWVWASTGVTEVAKSVQDAINDRLSIQYFCSNFNNGTGSLGTWAGNGGTLSMFAGFYNSTNMAIPWSNTNASFQDGAQAGDAGTSVPANTISTTPNYYIASITREYIPTQTVSQADAISNIKNIINQNKAVDFSFWLPDGAAGWTAFNTFWSSGAAATPYNYDSVAGLLGGGGHSVLCVGYYEGATLADSYWIMVNSWGITANRPDGIFRVAMDIDYTNTDSTGYWNLWWETATINFNVPAVVTPGTDSSPQPKPSLNEKPLSDYEKTSSGFTTLYYNRILLRAPDKEGLDGWVALLESGALTGVDLVNHFISSEECQAKVSGYTNEQFITFLYKIIFNRLPDPDGLNSWLTNMSAGMTKEEVVNNFGHSTEFESLCEYFGIKPYSGYAGTS